MNILIVEDNPERIKWFRDNFAGKLAFAYDVDSAIRLLKENTFRAIFLDHDLLPEHYNQDTNCDKTTGLAVAKYIAENPVSPDAEIVIHSRNWNGVGRMTAALVNGNRIVTCRPFHILSGLYL